MPRRTVKPAHHLGGNYQVHMTGHRLMENKPAGRGHQRSGLALAYQLSQLATFEYLLIPVTADAQQPQPELLTYDELVHLY